jgi:hypothetical protein
MSAGSLPVIVVYAMRLPSGDQSAMNSVALVATRGRCLEPSTFMTHRSKFPLSGTRSYTICRPSGENAGRCSDVVGELVRLVVGPLGNGLM